MSGYERLSAAVEGYVELTRGMGVAVAVMPAPDAEGASRRLGEALQRLPTGASERGLVVKDEDAHGGARRVRYYVMQHDIAALQRRVERYTAQRARMASQSAEGDMSGLLTLRREQELTFYELLSCAASGIYATTSGYAAELPFKGCLVNEGVNIAVVEASAFAAADGPTFAKGSYVRVVTAEELGAEAHQGLGRIYLATAEGAHGYSTLPDYAGAPEWEAQPEYADTMNRVTLLIAEQPEGGWNRQELERMHALIGDYLFYDIVMRWFALCSQTTYQPDVQAAGEAAARKRYELVVALDGRTEN